MDKTVCSSNAREEDAILYSAGVTRNLAGVATFGLLTGSQEVITCYTSN